MTLQQFRYIVAIDRFRHFGKAAEAFDLTQSTLSLMVKKLEEELDIRIFDREAHPVVPTEIGRKVIDQAKVILYNVEQLSEMTQTEKNLLSGGLKVAMISTVASVLVPGLFRYISDHYPEIEMVTEEMLTQTILDKLEKAEVDMGILAEPVQSPDLLSIPLYHERFMAYLSEEDPLYAEKEVTDHMLRRGKGWIMKNGLRLLDATTLDANTPFSYERYFEGSRVGTLVQMVNENGGLTIIPETHVSLILYSWQKNIRPIVEPELSRTIALVIRRDYIHEAKVNAVIKAIKQIIPPHLWENMVKSDYIRL